MERSFILEQGRLPVMQHLLRSDFGKPPFDLSLAWGWLGKIEAREYRRECERFVTMLEKDQRASGVLEDYAVHYFQEKGKSALESICKRVRVSNEEELQALDKVSSILLEWAKGSTSIQKRQTWVFELVAQYEERLRDIGILVEEPTTAELPGFSTPRWRKSISAHYHAGRTFAEIQPELWRLVLPKPNLAAA